MTSSGKPIHKPRYGIAQMIKSHCFHFISRSLLLAANKPKEKAKNVSIAENITEYTNKLKY